MTLRKNSANEFMRFSEHSFWGKSLFGEIFFCLVFDCLHHNSFKTKHFVLRFNFNWKNDRLLELLEDWVLIGCENLIEIFVT